VEEGKKNKGKKTHRPISKRSIGHQIKMLLECQKESEIQTRGFAKTERRIPGNVREWPGKRKGGPSSYAPGGVAKAKRDKKGSRSRKR